jgi:hypothetical protein
MKQTPHKMQSPQQQQSLNSMVHQQASLRQRLVCLQSRLRVSAGLTMLTQQSCRRLQTSRQSPGLQESRSLQGQEYLQICQVSLQERELCQVSWTAVAAAWGSAGSCRTAACLLVLLTCWRQRRSCGGWGCCRQQVKTLLLLLLLVSVLLMCWKQRRS